MHYAPARLSKLPARYQTHLSLSGLLVLVWVNCPPSLPTHNHPPASSIQSVAVIKIHMKPLPFQHCHAHLTAKYRLPSGISYTIILLLYHVAFVLTTCVPNLTKHPVKTVCTISIVCILTGPGLISTRSLWQRPTPDTAVLLTTSLCTSLCSTPQYAYHQNSYISSHCLDATVCN